MSSAVSTTTEVTLEELVARAERLLPAIADRALVLVEGRSHHEASAAALASDPALGALCLGGRPSMTTAPCRPSETGAFRRRRSTRSRPPD